MAVWCLIVTIFVTRCGRRPESAAVPVAIVANLLRLVRSGINDADAVSCSSVGLAGSEGMAVGLASAGPVDRPVQMLMECSCVPALRQTAAVDRSLQILAI